MLQLKYFIGIIAFFTVYSSEARRITVMVAKSDDRVESLKGLDVQVIENFAKKMKLQLKYIVTNKTLGTVFDLEATGKSSMSHSIAKL